MINTALTRTLGTEVPILVAPIGRGSTPKFLRSVADAGSLGFVALRHMPMAHIEAHLADYTLVTGGRFGINLTLLEDQRERLRIALAAGVKFVSLWHGEVRPYIELAKVAGAKVLWTVRDPADARVAADLGVDLIVAQGREAGGHVIGNSATMSLLPAVVDASGGVPVIAAGGIADGRGLAAALALGACGVWMGTRFVASQESASHPGYKETIVAATGDDIVETSLFDIGWSDAPHRVVRNSTYATWDAAGAPASGKRPGEGEIIAHFPSGDPVFRYDVSAPWAGMDGDWESMALYAGSSAQLVESVLPVRQIIDTTIATASAALKRASSSLSTQLSK